MEQTTAQRLVTQQQMIRTDMIENYRQYLIEEEKSRATIEKYIRDVYHLYDFLPQGKIIDKESIITYKKRLLDDYKVRSANSMLVSINCFFTFMGWGYFRVKAYKCQRKLVMETERELLRDEYQRLLEAAKMRGNVRIYHILQTICATGIRISELQFITLEAVKAGQAMVNLKGKNRVVIIEKKLRKELLRYCRGRDITAGHIFITRTGRPVDRSNIWTEMKKLCEGAQVSRKKVHPHNLRHLFARTYYKKYKDIVYLADILGHSNINTTRIYTSVSRMEHDRILTSLKLVI